jgi:predicted aspartyl protease
MFWKKPAPDLIRVGAVSEKLHAQSKQSDYGVKVSTANGMTRAALVQLQMVETALSVDREKSMVVPAT